MKIINNIIGITIQAIHTCLGSAIKRERIVKSGLYQTSSVKTVVSTVRVAYYEPSRRSR